MYYYELGSRHWYASNLDISKSTGPRHWLPISKWVIRWHSDIDYWHNVAIPCSESSRPRPDPTHCRSVWVLSVIVGISGISGIAGCCIGCRSLSENASHPAEYVGKGTCTLVYVLALSSLESWHRVWLSLFSRLIAILSLWLSRRWRSWVICRWWWCLTIHLRKFGLFMILVSCGSEIDVADI